MAVLGCVRDVSFEGALFSEVILPHYGEDVRVGESWIFSISQSQHFSPQYVVTSGHQVVVGEFLQSLHSRTRSLILLVDVALRDLIFAEGPVFLRNEDSSLVTTLTDTTLASLVTLTVTTAVLIVAGWNTDTAEASLSVETFFVLIRTDREVLTLVNINTGQIVLSHRVAGITADMTARGVEAGLSLLTGRALLTLVNISAGLLVLSQLVSRQTAPPAPHSVDTDFLRATVVDIRVALVNVPALLAIIQSLVTRLAS